MKRIGILGGMSAASSQIYYKTLCELTLNRFGGLKSPNLILRSLDFEPISKMMNDGKWLEIGKLLNLEAKNLQKAGAEIIVLASNTMHKLVDNVMLGIDLPLVHIGTATAQAILKNNCSKPAFLATKFTMEESFYVKILKENSIQPMIPNSKDRVLINQIIFSELCRNKIKPRSEKIYLKIVKNLQQAGADSVILGCTEICLLLNQGNTGLPVFDTTLIHCKAALKMAI